MTEQEAIWVLKDFDKQVTAKADGAYQSIIGKMACDVAISAFEEIQQYRALGTVEQLMDMKENYVEALRDWRQYRKIGRIEELREAREKQVPKKPKEYEDKYYGCPVCGNVLLHKWLRYPTHLANKTNGLPYCLGCGQAIDWSDTE